MAGTGGPEDAKENRKLVLGKTGLGISFKWLFRLGVLLFGTILLGAGVGLRVHKYGSFIANDSIICLEGAGVQHNQHMVDVCAVRTAADGGTDCGQPAADLFCQFSGYVWAFNWQQDKAEPNTTVYALGNSQTGGPQVFTEICCDDQEYWPSPPRWIVWTAGLLLMYIVSIVVTKLVLLAVEIIVVGLVATESLYFFHGIDRMFTQVIYSIGLVVWTYQCFWKLWCGGNPRECDERWLGNPAILWKVTKCIMAFQIGRLTTLLLGKAFGWALFFKNQLPQLRKVSKQERRLQSMTTPQWAEALIRAQEEQRAELSLASGQISRQIVSSGTYSAEGPVMVGSAPPLTKDNQVGFRSGRVIDYLSKDKGIFNMLPSRSKRWLGRIAEEDEDEVVLANNPPSDAGPAATTAALRGTPYSTAKSPGLSRVPEAASKPSASGVTVEISLPDSAVKAADAGFLEEALEATKQYEAEQEKLAAKQAAEELHSDIVAFTSGVGSLKKFRNFLIKYQNMADKQMDAEVEDLAKRLFDNLKTGLLRLSDIPKFDPSAEGEQADGEKKPEDDDCIVFTDFVNALQRASSKVQVVGIKRSASMLVEAAKQAWQMFDKEDAKMLRLIDVTTTLEEIYKHRRNLALSIRANEAVSRSLQSVIGSVLQTALLFVYLQIFGVSYAFTMGLDYFKSYVIFVSFLFRDHFKTIFNNVVYLLGQHPYDVGDELEFPKDGKWIVDSFDLMYTVFIGKNGEYSIFPNAYIATQHPINWDRTQRKKEKFKIRVPADMPMDIIPKIIEAMTKVYQKKFKDELAEDGGIKVRITDMPDSQTLILTSKFKFANPPPDDSRCKKAKKAMKDAVIACLLAEGVNTIPLNLDWGLLRLKNDKGGKQS